MSELVTWAAAQIVAVWIPIAGFTLAMRLAR